MRRSRVLLLFSVQLKDAIFFVALGLTWKSCWIRSHSRNLFSVGHHPTCSKKHQRLEGPKQDTGPQLFPKKGIWSLPQTQLISKTSPELLTTSVPRNSDISDFGSWIADPNSVPQPSASWDNHKSPSIMDLRKGEACIESLFDPISKWMTWTPLKMIFVEFYTDHNKIKTDR